MDRKQKTLSRFFFSRRSVPFDDHYTVRSGSEEYRTKLKDEVKYGIRFAFSSYAGVLPKGSSKLGGLPDLPSDLSWPGNAQGAPMPFIAQFNLRELFAYDPDGLLPDAGMLYFFFDMDSYLVSSCAPTQPFVCVRYYGGPVSSLERARLPEPGFKTSKEVSLRFMTYRELPDPDSDLLRNKELSSETVEALYREKDAVADRGIKISKLLGHADCIQCGMENTCLYLDHGYNVPDDPEAYARAENDGYHPDPRDVMLLLQIDSGEKTGMNWADDGRLYFWIGKEDLKKRNFDRVRAIVQSG